MARTYAFKELPKTCRNCGAAFTGHSNRAYCSKKCRDNNKDTLRARAIKRESNLAYFLREKIALAKHRGAYKVQIDAEYLQQLWNEQGGLCALSGVPMTYLKGKGRVPTNLSMDRKDSTKAYTADNVQLVCYQANLMKSELTEEQLVFWCERILYATRL